MPPYLLFTGARLPPGVEESRLRAYLFATIDASFLKYKRSFDLVMLNTDAPSYVTYRLFARLVKSLCRDAWQLLRHVFVVNHTWTNQFLDFLCTGELAYVYRTKVLAL
jgi:hypothetical protein